MEDLKQRISSRQVNVVVLGLGYIGLPLAIEAARAGFVVLGYDPAADKTAALAAGRSTVLDIEDDDVAEQIAAGRFRPSSDPKILNRADVFVICVPTPLKHELPDMSFIESAAAEIARRMRRGTLVILESTTYPGTTDEALRQILESNGFVAGEDFWLGFSPERIDPGNAHYGLRNVPKLIGGFDDASTDLMEAFYSSFITKIVRMSSPRAAEMAKLVENTYRHINIALANEMAILAHDLEVDIWEVIDAAATKPFGFHPFYPGPGWGGHCIPVDPAYLSWRVRQMGETAHFVELAREINERMPAYVVQRVSEILNRDGKSLNGARVLLLGVTYKADVADVRESPALAILRRLLKGNADVSFHDPYVSDLSDEGIDLQGRELNEETLRNTDLVIMITPHSAFDGPWIAEHASRIFDTRNVLRGGGDHIEML
ncbi:MAG: nucleotide sugar dehydrogenase [Actinomycetota bacterium]